MVGVRWLPALAAAVLALSAFNLTFRLGSEGLTEWDESLYATSALEMVRNQEWVATTFDGALDYSNSKPPLNVWLLALSMQTFGVSLVSLRLVSIVASALTILGLARLGLASLQSAPVGIFSAFVLATCFGFLYVHSGRTANPDALMTLFLLLIVIVLDASRDAPGRRVWLGPLLAGVFFLKGMAVVMPLLLIARHGMASAGGRPARAVAAARDRLRDRRGSDCRVGRCPLAGRRLDVLRAAVLSGFRQPEHDGARWPLRVAALLPEHPGEASLRLDGGRAGGGDSLPASIVGVCPAIAALLGRWQRAQGAHRRVGRRSR